MEHKYPSMDNYYKSVGDMLGDPVVITEKLDGSNFSVRVFLDTDFEWKVEYRSRNQSVNTDSNSLFAQAIVIADSLKDKLLLLMGQFPAVEAIFYFEVIGEGIQKRIPYHNFFVDGAYPVIKNRTIAIIDVYTIRVKDDEGRPVEHRWLTWDEVANISDFLGVFLPYSEKVEALTLAHIEDLVEEKEIEGYVLRAEKDGEVLYTHYGDLKRVKLKTNWYNSFEKKGARNKTAKPKTPPEIIEFLMDRINFGRLHSVYSHGHEELVHEMKDMKYLIDLVVEDIKAEDDSLWENFESEVIRKTCAKMLPKILQGYLLERNT